MSVFTPGGFTRPSPLRLGLRTLLGRAYPRLIGQQREPAWLFFDIVLPLLAVAALLLVYRALGADPRFEGYVILGGAMTTFWLHTIWMMAMQFHWEKQSGNLSIYLTSPGGLMWILGGMAVGGSLATTVRASAVMVFGAVVFRVPFVWDGAVAALAVLAVTLTALYGVGMVASSFFLRFGRGVEKVMETLEEPVYLVTGSFFPVSALGTGVAVAGSVIPLTLGLDGLRQLLLPGDAGELAAWWVEALILGGYSVLALGAAHRALAWMERTAKRDGRITDRWL